MDRQPGLNLSGSSATDILDHLYSDHINNDDDDEEEEVYGAINEYDHVYCGYGSPNKGDNETGIEIKEDDDEKIDGDDDKMSFCDVGFVLDQVEGDEGWCLVEEM
jgi:hypothetical protein